MSASMPSDQKQIGNETDGMQGAWEISDRR
jgi:hypothetical protein